MGEKGDGNSGWTITAVDGGFLNTDRLERVIPTVRAAAFWGAVCLPWVALAFLFSGLATRFPLVFTGIIAVALVSAVVGHEYTRQ